jgi:outer membrane protein assembly factor BamE
MRRSLIFVLGTLLLGGCSSVKTTDSLFGLITPYKIDIVQGNVVTQEQLALLKPGLTRSQVRDVLGTPLLTDPFHADRWDYLFTIRRPGTAVQRRDVIVHFDGDRMTSVESPALPTEGEFVESISPPVKAKPRTLALTEAQIGALPVPPKPAPPAAAASAPAHVYPPLDAS